MTTRSEKMGWNATWSMAVGGMIGGGIFSVLGVVVDLAGALAWLSFLIAGFIALATAFSYVRLSARFGEGGGAFTFLRKVGREGLAGSLSWILIAGYVLTMAVYAFTFGHYIGEVAHLGDLFVRLLAIAIISALVVVNLRGVGESSGLEIVTVWGKLAVLLGLAAIGLWRWQPAQLSSGVGGGTLSGALVGAASVFMAYEGFQLLTYDYDDIRDPKRTLTRAVLSAVVAVTAVYVAVALGAAMLVGAKVIVQQKEVALAAAGQEALGTAGRVLVSIAAGFSTASAINATLFATARLAKRVSDEGELPSAAAHQTDHQVPDRAIVALGVAAIALATIGSLSTLVEAASLTFLLTFAAVNVIAAVRLGSWRWISGAGAAGAGIGAVALGVRLLLTRPLALIALAILIAIATLLRPRILHHGRARS